MNNFNDAKQVLLTWTEISKLGQQMFGLTNKQLKDAGFEKGLSDKTPGEWLWRKKQLKDNK